VEWLKVKALSSSDGGEDAGFGKQLGHILRTLLMAYKDRKILAVIYEEHSTE
jgi:hypothetical protein